MLGSNFSNAFKIVSVDQTKIPEFQKYMSDLKKFSANCILGFSVNLKTF